VSDKDQAAAVVIYGASVEHDSLVEKNPGADDQLTGSELQKTAPRLSDPRFGEDEIGPGRVGDEGRTVPVFRPGVLDSCLEGLAGRFPVRQISPGS
jgi:hypothetical protein